MKDLVFDHILSVGVDEIDDDHRRLVELFNILNHAVQLDDTPKYLEAVLEELINLTRWHFSHEERLMLRHGYPGLAEHRQEHQELIRTAQDLQQKIIHSDNRFVDDDIEFIERWLTEHILTADMKLGSWMVEVVG